MRFRISIVLMVALLGFVAIGLEQAAGADAVRTAGYTRAYGTPAPATSLNLPMQISDSVHVNGGVPATTVGFHHRYAAAYGPRYAYRPYYAPYVAYRPYYYAPRPYVYGGFYPPYWGGNFGGPAVYGGPGFYGGPAVYGSGYWGGYPGAYRW